ncbi:hypothetical protein RV04_GL001539 [Enterococcus hermanniensis]|uniref:Uncharacterized protein n=1 Tax=Enterococcus hermanniensis TaxID=249189 RepID=A0A1L8T8R9_9ENTE|nr:hypothetical protein RV04_GL001539 [Enterococcus hermanniensis]
MENPNKAYYGISTGIPTAMSVGSEETSTGYLALSKKDGNLRSASNGGLNTVRFSRLSYNILQHVKNLLGEDFFVDRGANDTISQVAVLKTLDITGVNQIWGYGSSVGGNKLTTKIYSSGAWAKETISTMGSISEITQNISSSEMKTMIQSDGFVHVLIHTEPSDNVTASSVTLDCGMFDLKIKVSANDYIKSMIASNHVTNLATAEEATAGTNTTKTMTPATTAQSIDNRAVTLASNQTIGGIKNFKDGLMLADTSVVVDRYIEKTVVTTNTTDFSADSTVYFQRWGRMVVASVSITNKAANFAAWKTLMQFPDGYKPNRRIGWGGTLTNNTNRAPSLSVYANDSGISVMSPSSDFPASQNCVGTIVYFTSDAWPS